MLTSDKDRFSFLPRAGLTLTNAQLEDSGVYTVMINSHDGSGLIITEQRSVTLLVAGSLHTVSVLDLALSRSTLGGIVLLGNAFARPTLSLNSFSKVFLDRVSMSTTDHSQPGWIVVCFLSLLASPSRRQCCNAFAVVCLHAQL